MGEAIRNLVKFYRYLNDDLSDPRTKDYWLLDSPMPLITIIWAYLYFVNKAGPEMMKDRKPYKIDRIIQVYNILQIIANSYFIYIGYARIYGPNGKYNLYCEPVDYSQTPFALEVTNYFWLYFMVKISDLLDTVFFVLRKKNSQITFLHKYHHVGMTIIVYVATKYYGGGQGIFLGIINAAVHVLMYSYYFITNYSAEYKKNLWWKKHLTQIQMVQFGLIILHFCSSFICDCGYPKLPAGMLIFQNIIIFYLFWDFYKKAYLSKEKPKMNGHKITSKDS